MSKDIKAKFLLLGYTSEIVTAFYDVLDVWPDREKVEKVINAREIYSNFCVRFICPETVITTDMDFKRLNINYNKENIITNINVG